jgi:NOL1/NOP2/fmu family ribosome biogenesis protein
LHESESPLRQEILSYLTERFGVPESILADLQFVERGVEIWGTTANVPPGLHPRRPAGLRALRRRPDGLKPTSSFLLTLDPSIVRNRVELTLEDLRQLLLGRRVFSQVSPGYVALSFQERIIGCGRVHREALQALIPTGRRRELLDALAREM